MEKGQRLIYQGGVPIGYFEGDAAVLDSEFIGCAAGRKLTLAGVSLAWRDGVAAMLRQDADEQREEGKRVRVYQLTAATTPEKKFIPYGKLCERYGGAKRTDYHLVFDGRVCFENLNDLYEVFHTGELPKGYTGRRLSMSDIVELCREEGSTLYYVDAEDYVMIEWKECENR